MFKLLKTLLAFAAGGSFCVSAAGAQNAGPGAPAAENQIYQSISAADISSILSDFEITSQFAAAGENEAPVLLAQSPGGARFIVSFLNCLDLAAATGCDDFMIITAMPSAGATYEELNDFNGAYETARAVYDAENQLVLFGAYAVVAGGAGRINLALTLSSYFNNLNTYFTNRSASAKSVSFSDTLGASATEFPEMSGQDAQFPSLMRDVSKTLVRHQINMAIHNRWSSRFPETPEKIKNH